MHLPTTPSGKPARRVYIPKANHKVRPLGMPVVVDRCLQALVKVHTSNVYRKLSVNNRRAAVTLARALGFLAADRTDIT